MKRRHINSHTQTQKNVCDYFPTARDGESAICQKIREKVLFPARREDFAGDEEGSFVPGASEIFFWSFWIWNARAGKMRDIFFPGSLSLSAYAHMSVSLAAAVLFKSRRSRWSRFFRRIRSRDGVFFSHKHTHSPPTNEHHPLSISFSKKKCQTTDCCYATILLFNRSRGKVWHERFRENCLGKVGRHWKQRSSDHVRCRCHGCVVVVLHRRRRDQLHPVVAESYGVGRFGILCLVRVQIRFVQGLEKGVAINRGRFVGEDFWHLRMMRSFTCWVKYHRKRERERERTLSHALSRFRRAARTNDITNSKIWANFLIYISENVLYYISKELIHQHERI